MSGPAVFHVPFLRTPSRKQKHSRSMNVTRPTVTGGNPCDAREKMELDYSDYYPIGSPNSSRYNHLELLQKKFSGNPLSHPPSIMDMDEHSVCTFASLETSTSSTIGDGGPQIMVWSCQHCDRALFRTEHETMIHELTCPENKSGPLTKKKKEVKHPEFMSDDNDRRGRHVARVLLRKSKSKKENTDKADRLNHEESSTKSKKKSKNYLVRSIRKITKRKKKKKKKNRGVGEKVNNQAPNLEEYFSRQQSIASQVRSVRTVVTDDNTMETADTYDLPETPLHEVEVGNANPFQERRRLKPITCVRPPQITFAHQSNSHISMVDETPHSLCSRPSSEELMEQLGLTEDHVARSAIESLHSRSCDSSVHTEEGSWAEEQIQGVRVPNYSQYVDMAVTGFRRDVLNINDDLYQTLQSVACRMIQAQTNKQQHGLTSVTL